MGLLLGASVITLFEVIDLLCYNTLRKVAISHGRTTKINDDKTRTLKAETPKSEQPFGWVKHK